jgi:hypothetical protein
MISAQALQDFKVIWKSQFGEDISDEKATEEALNLLNLFNVIYRPIKKELSNEYENKHRRHND